MARVTALRLLSVLLTVSLCRAIARAQASASDACIALDEKVKTEVARGRRAAAELLLSEALASSASRTEHSCAGLVLTGIAVRMSISGQLDEAEKFTARAIRILEENYPPDDPVFFRPLHILASARFERGEVGRAREAFKRMRMIRIERTEDRALMSGLAAVLLSAEGRYREAESEFLLALQSWEHAGRGEMADAGTVLNALGSLYIREHRLDDAQQVLDRALGIFTSAKDAVPMDRFKLLEVRAVMHAWRHEWSTAEQDLRDAVAMVDSLPGLDPSFLVRVLADYAYVLRKNHHKREARSIEARATGLHSQSITSLVDASELRAHSKGTKK